VVGASDSGAASAEGSPSPRAEFCAALLAYSWRVYLPEASWGEGSIEEYERTAAEEEELGLTDMKTENYSEEAQTNGATYPIYLSQSKLKQ
jgi:hypothetical protein